MQSTSTRRMRRWRLGLLVSTAFLLGGCGLDPSTRNPLIGAGVFALGLTPTTNLEQVYYLGVLDPQDQVPPTLYRVRVRGQASALNFTRYASGWVHADLIDSLASTVKFAGKELNDGVKVDADPAGAKTFTPGRRLVMFGPEGFREAPASHRLVIAMGSSPEKFFDAVDQALGNVAAVTQGFSGADLERGLFKELFRLRSERERLTDIQSEVQSAGAAK
jgi:hypothetical protein